MKTILLNVKIMDYFDCLDDDTIYFIGNLSDYIYNFDVNSELSFLGFFFTFFLLLMTVSFILTILSRCCYNCYYCYYYCCKYDEERYIINKNEFYKLVEPITTVDRLKKAIPEKDRENIKLKKDLIELYFELFYEE